jgi:long-chain acyl-CoA synthetase
VPEGLRAVEELPRNALSKVDRNALQVMAASNDNAGHSQNAVASAPARASRAGKAKGVARGA